MFFCRFDSKWLKEEFYDVKKINGIKGLSDKARKYVEIFHEKHFNTHLPAKNPSRSDILALQEAYGKLIFFISDRLGEKGLLDSILN